MVIKTPTASPSHGRYNVTQEKLMLFVFERQKLSFQLAVLMYSMSSKCKMHVVLCVCVCVCMWLGMQLVSIKAVSLLSLSLPFSIYLIAWAWGKVLIIFSFIQMNNPEALCTRVPSWETSHIWQRLRCFRNSLSLWVTGAPFFVSFNIQRAP